MEHILTTAYGPGTRVGLIVSVFGIKQGSTDGPSGWTCISNPVLKTYHKRCNGCALDDSTGTIKVKANADMFVDDNTFIHNNNNKDVDPEKLMSQIQRNAETCGRLLCSTGGQLEFSKSTYSLMNWDFYRDGKPHLVKEQELPLNYVQLQNAQGEGTQLRRKPTNKGVKMLGVTKSCTLNDNEEFDLLSHTKNIHKSFNSISTKTRQNLDRIQNDL